MTVEARGSGVALALMSLALGCSQAPGGAGAASLAGYKPLDVPCANGARPSLGAACCFLSAVDSPPTCGWAAVSDGSRVTLTFAGPRGALYPVPVTFFGPGQLPTQGDCLDGRVGYQLDVSGLGALTSQGVHVNGGLVGADGNWAYSSVTPLVATSSTAALQVAWDEPAGTCARVYASHLGAYKTFENFSFRIGSARYTQVRTEKEPLGYVFVSARGPDLRRAQTPTQARAAP